jgi:hypothetical protein
MIRRLFWLILGAVLGVTGYRRAARLARAVTRPGLGGRRAAPAGDLARRAAFFARDVREGMDLYADRHPRLAGRTLEGQQARAERPDGARPDDDHARRAYPRLHYAKEGR